MLTDADAEEAVEGREDGLDRSPFRHPLGTVGIGRDIPSCQLRNGERPTDESQGLDERGSGTADDRQDREHEWPREHDRQHRRQRQHRERAEEESLPPQDQPRPTRGESMEDSSGSRRRMSG